MPLPVERFQLISYQLILFPQKGIVHSVWKVILGYAYSLTFCSKINLNFLWSEILLQRYVFFAFLAMFWTWTTSNVWKECDTFDNKYELEACKSRIICLSGQCFYLLKLLAVVATFVMTSKDSTFIKVNKEQNIFHLQHQEILSKWYQANSFIQMLFNLIFLLERRLPKLFLMLCTDILYRRVISLQAVVYE